MNLQRRRVSSSGNGMAVQGRERIRDGRKIIAAGRRAPEDFLDNQCPAGQGDRGRQGLDATRRVPAWWLRVEGGVPGRSAQLRGPGPTGSCAECAAPGRSRRSASDRGRCPWSTEPSVAREKFPARCPMCGEVRQSVRRSGPAVTCVPLCVGFVLAQPRQQLGEIARLVADIELVFQDVVPAVPAGTG